MAKDTLKGTVARIGKNGVWDHRHDDSGWHWACAGHNDEGQRHKLANADKPVKFADDTPENLKASYLPTVRQQEGFMSYSPSKKNDMKGVYVKARVMRPEPAAPTPAPAASE